jgi:hypothetical protein
MSTRTIGTPISLPDDPRKIEFVRSLLTKTREGKVSWVKKGGAFSAAVPDGITINFVLGSSPLGLPTSWDLFTVRDKTGNELIQVRGLDFFSVGRTDPLRDATSELFAVVSAGVSGDELERAIESLKRL